MFTCSRRWAGILLVFLFLATAVAACSPMQDDAEDTTDTPAPTATLAPTATPVPTTAPAQTAMSSDSHAEMFCGDTGSEEIESMTFGQLAAELTGAIELLEAMEPPQEYAGWHEVRPTI